MALSTLLDTSVLTRLRHPSVRAVVEPLAARGEAARAGISDLEIGYSARNDAEWDSRMRSLEVFLLVETTAQHVRRARQVERMLAARSQSGRKIPDLLVAAAAEELEYTILHYDRDFDLIATVTGQRCKWVVPQGSIG